MTCPPQPNPEESGAADPTIYGGRQSTPSTPRNDFIDYLKGSLIFLVVWGHLIQSAFHGDDTGFFYDPVFKAIYMFHMPLFMAVSGFVSFRSIFSSPFLFCVWRRIRQIIVPAICWPVLALIASLLFCLFHERTLAGGMHLFIKSLPAFRPGLWFLWAVFGSTAVVSALKMLRLDRLEIFAAATILFLFAPDGANIYLFKYTFPFFCAGYALAKGNQIHLPKTISPPQGVVLFAASVGCYLLWGINTYVYKTRMHPDFSNLYNISLRYLIGMVVSGAFILLMLLFYQVAKSRMLSNWGRRSLDIYIMHGFVLDGLESIGNPLQYSLWYSFLAAPVLAVLLCFATYQAGRAISKIPVARALLLGEVQKS
jgi:fucose 4-O-acetylase-like acetyltransferase